jgi:hypothetical protein
MYGIRLGGLVVLDLDADDAALVETLEARFGPAAVHVRTSRGRHLWYHAPEGALPNLRGEGLPVDVKSGPNAYVAGPGSVRPDGQPYVLAKGDLTTDALTVLGLSLEATAPGRLAAAPWASKLSEIFGTASAPSPPRPTLASLEVVGGGRVPEGKRHDTLKREAARAARHALSQADLTQHLRLVVARDFANPGTFSDAEVAGLAAWAWKKRLENNLWNGAASAISIRRDALDVLRGHPHQDEAVALYVRLLGEHGHRPGVVFPLDHAAMKEGGLVSMGRRSFLHARRTLEESGLLRMAQRACVGVQPALYQLGLPRSR